MSSLYKRALAISDLYAHQREEKKRLDPWTVLTKLQAMARGVDWTDVLTHNGWEYRPLEDRYVNSATGETIDYFEAMEKLQMGSGSGSMANNIPTTTGTWTTTPLMWATGQTPNWAITVSSTSANPWSQISTSGNFSIGNPIIGTTLPHTYAVGQCEEFAMGNGHLVTVWWTGSRWTTNYDDVIEAMKPPPVKGDSGLSLEELERAENMIEELSGA